METTIVAAHQSVAGHGGADAIRLPRKRRSDCGHSLGGLGSEQITYIKDLNSLRGAS